MNPWVGLLIILVSSMAIVAFIGVLILSHRIDELEKKK